MPVTIEQYYQTLKSPQKEICLKLRELIHETYPSLKESMLWGVPVFKDGLFYIVSLKDHVNLGFTVSNLSRSEENLFQGGGKTTRKVEFKSIDDIDEQEVIALLDFVYKKSS
jgi:hypothetical protein